jgi:LPXTG-site transpeptidase (sortase) family protein
MLVPSYKATTGSPVLPNPHQIVTASVPVPAEQPVTDGLGGYTVPAEQPRSLRIASANIFGPIQQMGLTTTGALAAPTNINFAGWYVGSARPGDVGLSVIDGHITGRFSNGIFNRLHAVAVGDEITIQFGDLTVRHFVVVDKQVLPEAQAATVLFAKRPNIASQLNLITCSVFDAATKTYTHRTILVAKLIPA